MPQKKNQTAPKLETFDVAHLGQLWADSTGRIVDEVEKAGQATLTQLERLGEEGRKAADAQMKSASRIFGASIETARRLSDAIKG